MKKALALALSIIVMCAMFLCGCNNPNVDQGYDNKDPGTDNKTGLNVIVDPNNKDAAGDNNLYE